LKRNFKAEVKVVGRAAAAAEVENNRENIKQPLLLTPENEPRKGDTNFGIISSAFGSGNF
jgi:hypothetical protein